MPPESMPNFELEGWKTLSGTINQTVLVSAALITAAIAIYEKVLKNQSKAAKGALILTLVLLTVGIISGLFAGQYVSFLLITNKADNFVDHTTFSAQIHFYSFGAGILSLICFILLSIRESTVKSKTGIYLYNSVLKSGSLQNIESLYSLWLNSFEIEIDKEVAEIVKKQFLNRMETLIKAEKLWIVKNGDVLIGWCYLEDNDSWKVNYFIQQSYQKQEAIMKMLENLIIKQQDEKK